MRPSNMLGAPSVPPLRGMTAAVYGLVLPETRAMVRRLWSERPESLFERAYEDVQDAAHTVFLDAWAAWVAPLVGGLGRFSHRYVTNGSSEAIRESVWALAAEAHATGVEPHLHVFAGEYEGYAAYARAAGVTVVTHRRDRPVDTSAYTARARHRWYVSQPSAIDGNAWPGLDGFVRELAERDVEIAVDLAYVGATAKRLSIDLSSPNVRYVFFSLSKVFGVFYHRVGGVLTNAPLLGLEGNKWFKNMFSLYLGTALLRETPEPTTLPSKYRDIQLEACEQLRTEHGIDLAPSDVILLASSAEGPHPAAYRRGARYRYCLTPALDRLLRGDAGGQGGETDA